MFAEQPLAAALRPLRRPATAEGPDPGWEAVVAVDMSPTMVIWSERVAAFLAALRRQRAIHAVRVCDLGRAAAFPAGIAQAGPHRRRLVLVVSDGTGPTWGDPDAVAVLSDWARHSPTALIHLLPQHLWHRTRLRPRRALLRAAAPGAANTRLRWNVLDDIGDGEPTGPPDVVLPVLELQPQWLSAWTELVAGSSRRPIMFPTLLLRRPARAGTGAAAPVTAQRPGRQRVREFLSWATPDALALATVLAAVPLYRSVIQVIQREVLPSTGTAELAEILTSDLVTAPSRSGSETAPAFDFHPGVREELLASGRRSSTTRAWRALGSRLGRELPAIGRISAALERPDSTALPTVTAAGEGLARLELALLRALSGRYLARARQLGEALDAVRPDPAASDESDTPGGATRNAMIAVREVERHLTIRRGGEGVSTSSQADMTGTSKIPAIWGNIPPQNPNFTGRVDLLDKLHQQIRGGPTAVLPHTLHGMGGVGKSHLAIEYVYQHQSEYDLIWWIPAERTAQIGASFVELAQRMDLAEGSDVDSARAAVHETLRVGVPYARWLLIFDNAESPDTLLQYLPTGGSGSIVITSRNPSWASVARTLEVDVFTRPESIEFLRRRSPELEESDADALADALGDLPLAIEQAAAWRAETGMPAEEYLRLFSEKRVELLEQAPSNDYQLPVAAAWNVSLDRLVVSNPAAFRLLQLCSFLAPEPIPRSLFNGAQNVDIHPELNAALRNPMRLNRAIRDVNRYALARVNHRTNSIQMHRLVQAVLIDRMSDSERESMRHSAHLLLASGDRNDPDSPANWRSYADLYPHVIVSDAVQCTAPWVQQLVHNEARYLYWWGEFKASLELSEKAYAEWRRSAGEDAIATLMMGHWLGFILYRVGRYREAAEQNAQILEAHRQGEQEDNEELLKAIGAVAADLRIAGDFHRALEMDEDLYQRHVRLFGEEEPPTLNAAHNLAVSLRLVGDIRRAYEVDNATYQQRVRLFGEDHAQTLESHLNLIIDRRELGQYLSARIEMQNIVDRLPRVWGPAQTQTLLAKRRLASAIRKAGEHELALKVSQEVLEGFTARLDRRHPDTLLTAFGLAVDLRATGNLKAAAELSEQTILSYGEIFDAEHPYTVAARLNTAIIYRLRGEVERARATNEHGIEQLSRKLGPDHPLPLAGMVNLANDLYLLGDAEGAYRRDAETAERCRRLFGDEHPSTLICLGNLAMDLMALGRRSEAHELHDDLKPRFLRTLGANHPGTKAGIDITVRGDCDLDPMPL